VLHVPWYDWRHLGSHTEQMEYVAHLLQSGANLSVEVTLNPKP